MCADPTHAEAVNENRLLRQANEYLQRGWPHAWIRHPDGDPRWHVFVVDFDPVHGFTHDDHPTDSYAEAWAWADGMRRLLR
ncbi:hypothetical protein [Jiangella asiatica]|uniref:Uncharacterized protein n=1 Tax=Jiangella asiatica TaxID=2530372 RepID=A0A4R5CS79_9ACTN|nr:hypothetical protein [Jiangella asiatica]TDE03429.1 hypothetical protein E1269_20540 [Jiangella asiatica]